MKRIEITTKSRDQMIDISNAVQNAVSQLGITFGNVTVFTPHTTCAITINENVDPGVRTDFLAHMDRTVLWASAAYQHRGGNAAAHIKSSLVGASVSIIVDSGQIKLGVWQAIYLCEFDGPRAREIWIG